MSHAVSAHCMCHNSVQLLLPVHSKMTDSSYMLEHVYIIIIQFKPCKSTSGKRALMSSIVEIGFTTPFWVVTLILPLYVHACLKYFLACKLRVVLYSRSRYVVKSQVHSYTEKRELSWSQPCRLKCQSKLSLRIGIMTNLFCTQCFKIFFVWKNCCSLI